MIASDNNILCFGTENGTIKDIDIKQKEIIRRTKAHDGSQITALTS